MLRSQSGVNLCTETLHSAAAANGAVQCRNIRPECFLSQKLFNPHFSLSQLPPSDLQTGSRVRMHTIRYTSACLHRTECCFFPIPHTHHLSTGIRLMISYSRKAPPKAAAATAIYFTPAGIGESYIKKAQEVNSGTDKVPRTSSPYTGRTQ